ncbi:uncharacterized protein LOC125474967 isoform X2 [Pyrus x bretschneideri]|uniref:uncharacterized protein LOC125474967 isoform X2 n=1 Tax=Pyrus x bretschneideri TaxID=225117 RepID=UPI00202FA27E|nr:uncharacterized protein LOC125474967 isoform X2 [Pyrus x bretschneideri]
MASQLIQPTVTKGRDEVYVAAVPLRATKGDAQLLTSAAYSLNLWNLLHLMAMVFDFQPKDPENIYVALAVLSGKAISGLVEYLIDEEHILERLEGKQKH